MFDASAPVSVTDHAVLRWIERVHGIDIDIIRAFIADATREAINAGATGVQVDGYLYVLSPDNRSVVTVLSPEQRKSRYPGALGRHIFAGSK